MPRKPQGEGRRNAGRKATAKDAATAAPTSFADRYPHIASWLQDGWIEMGRDDSGRSFVRALDAGGTVWEGEPTYPSVDAALTALDAGIAEWLDENG